MIDATGRDIRLEVDGGIAPGDRARVVEAGRRHAGRRHRDLRRPRLRPRLRRPAGGRGPALGSRMSGSGRWLRNARRAMARLPSLRLSRVPDAPALPVRDPWPGDATRGARLLKGELEIGGGVRALKPGGWAETDGPDPLRAAAHGFTWLRDLRALGTPAALLRARALVADWIATPRRRRLVHRPDVTGARITAWLGHYDFIAASGDDAFRQKLMARLVADARGLAAALPAEELDARGLTALKGLIAAAVALPDHAAFLTRALRFLPQEIARQVLPDGCHAERSPAAHLAALQDLTEIRSLLQAAQVQLPGALPAAIERMGPALRVLRHGDGGLALFNGSKEESPNLVELVLANARAAAASPRSSATAASSVCRPAAPC